MKLQSWIGKNIRIKKEFLVESEDENEFGVVSRSYYINDGKALNSFILKPESQVFYVLMDVWGADMFSFRKREAETDDLELSHQLILRGGLFDYPFLWEAKYFEITDEPVTD